MKVNGSVSPLADLNVEIQISYKTSKSQARPIRTYKPNPGYIAGVPSFNLSSSVPDRLVNIGKLVEITVKILISRMTLSGKLYVSENVINVFYFSSLGNMLPALNCHIFTFNLTQLDNFVKLTSYNEQAIHSLVGN